MKAAQSRSVHTPIFGSPWPSSYSRRRAAQFSRESGTGSPKPAYKDGDLAAWFGLGIAEISVDQCLPPPSYHLIPMNVARAINILRRGLEDHHSALFYVIIDISYDPQSLQAKLADRDPVVGAVLVFA